MKLYKHITTGQTRHFETKNGRVITTIKINDRWVSNPTIEQFKNEGWQPYTPPEPQQEPLTYKQRVTKYIRERYDTDDEIALLRQRDEKPEEFAEYNAYVEWCKKEAKKEGKK